MAYIIESLLTFRLLSSGCSLTKQFQTGDAVSGKFYKHYVDEMWPLVTRMYVWGLFVVVAWIGHCFFQI